MRDSAHDHTITITDSGQVFTCVPGESVLRALARSGRRGIPIGCRGGGCGVCRIQVLTGSYHAEVMSRAHISIEEERAGCVLACRIFPLADLAVRVVGKLQRAVS